jgi:hypothetical protein
MRHIMKTRTWQDADSKTYFYMIHTSQYMPSVNWKEVLHSWRTTGSQSERLFLHTETVPWRRVDKNSREFSISVTSILQWWDYMKLLVAQGVSNYLTEELFIFKKVSAPKKCVWVSGCLVGWLVGWLLDGWLVGWFVSWLIGWLTGWLVC